MIQIKRLKQSGSEFVPITLAEAVVVNAENISGFEQITTLDKVLEQYCGLTAYTIASIENINKDLKNIDNTYQKKLTAGIGITITDDGIISASFETKGLSYKISIEGLPTAGKNCLDTIYLVPSK
jgi:arabinogalactan endo-1,4-beta-galactosidase